jgi:pimeloyl-ACP methyl ester carboxylesterase
MEGPVAVLLPGAGSSADFVRRAFARPLTEAGCELVAVSPVPGPGVVEAGYAALDAAARAYGPRLTLAGGISLGAHIAARWAAATAAAPGLLLALPAWSGAPGPVAAATAAAADRVARLGMGDAVRAAGAGPVRWVAAELAAAWPAYGAELVATLRAAAAAPGPSVAELRSVTAAAGVVCFADDPLHPAGVAEEWASLLPRGGLARLRLADLAGDRSVLGSAALRALKAALAAR